MKWFLGKAMLTLALAVGSAGVVGAQADARPGDADRGRDTRNDRGFDWGWLGLIGLAGLAGLMGRNGTHRRDATTGTMSGTAARH